MPSLTIGVAVEIDNTDCDISPVLELDDCLNIVPTIGGSVSPPTPIGMQLQAVHGYWSNNPTAYSYQWQRSLSGNSNWSNISSETNSDYVVALADTGYFLRPVETATNLAGSATRAGQVVGPISGGGGGGGGGPPGVPGSIRCRVFSRS